MHALRVRERYTFPSKRERERERGGGGRSWCAGAEGNVEVNVSPPFSLSLYYLSLYLSSRGEGGGGPPRGWRGPRVGKAWHLMPVLLPNKRKEEQEEQEQEDNCKHSIWVCLSCSCKGEGGKARGPLLSPSTPSLFWVPFSPFFLLLFSWLRARGERERERERERGGMAKTATGGCGSGRERKRGSRRGQRNLPANICLAGAAALLSLTMNLVMFHRFLPFYKSEVPSSGCSPSSPPPPPPPPPPRPDEMGEAAPETLLFPHTLGVDISGDVSGIPDEDAIVVKLDHGDPTMYEPFWRAMEEKGSIAIPGWKTMSYFSDGGGLCWFMESRLAREIVRLHRLVGNARTAGYHIVVGSGSTQLFQAALYALVPTDATGPVSVVASAPYYSFYPAVTDYLRSGLYRWAGDANSFHDDAPYIEVVCSPNNPDGFLREAVLNKENGKTIHDLAYYWPQYSAITYEASHEIMLFTFSKITGHAGTRIGWALVKDRDVAARMTKFIELNTIGVSKDSQLRAAQILGAISDDYEHPSPTRVERFFNYGRRLLAERWERLREAVRTTRSFSLPEFPPAYCKFTGHMSELHPAFAWLKCEKDDVEDCEQFLRRLNIIARSGKHSGSGLRYVRVSLLDTDEKFGLFIKRILAVR